MEEQEYRRYDKAIEDIRHREFPMLEGKLLCDSEALYANICEGTTYLDHAGTTLYPKSLIERFSADMTANLYGNPHSASNSSQLTTRRIEDVRLRLLNLFHADPENFDVVFVANATAGIKLVMDAFRDREEGFWYGYHRDAHTSLIGARELAKNHRCFTSDQEVEEWLKWPQNEDLPGVFAYPAQSNMNGRRLPLSWTRRIRTTKSNMYSLLDAAALVSTSALDLSNASSAPDFTVLSLYKIFGFPDLGALIVRKESASVFNERRYFGGGTVEMVVCLKEQWHAKKSENLHERLEDGTLPIHSIMALDAAMAVHQELFQSLERVSLQTAYLSKRLYEGLSSLRHGNGVPVCQVYKDPASTYGETATQGPIVAFNLRSHLGAWVSNAEVEKLAAVKNIQLRTGGLCNPGGVASSLGLAPWEMKDNFSAGQRCGNDNDIMRGKPTGMIRVSLGAMSTLHDVTLFVDFVREFFLQDEPPLPTPPVTPAATEPPMLSQLHVESLTIYPLKSCAGWSVPPGTAWEVRREGLAWDREWCLVHQGTSAALSQKRYPKMALIRPSIDLEAGVLHVQLAGILRNVTSKHEITIPLSADPRMFSDTAMYRESDAKVCGDSIRAKTYKAREISDFFTDALGVACHLARFPAVNKGSSSSRHAKAHLQKQSQKASLMHVPGAFPDSTPPALATPFSKPILLSNESPILTISRSSLNRLNEQIKAGGGKAAQADVFRANIVVAENMGSVPGGEQPYAEDNWRFLKIGEQYFDLLGPCRRCQMICVDQQTAERNQEPFVTLSKTRRVNGRVYFGEHSSHMPIDDASSPLSQYSTIRVGDAVRPFMEDEWHLDDSLRALVS